MFAGLISDTAASIVDTSGTNSALVELREQFHRRVVLHHFARLIQVIVDGSTWIQSARLEAAGVIKWPVVPRHAALSIHEVRRVQ